jgi:hypothetical protein
MTEQEALALHDPVAQAELVTAPDDEEDDEWDG